MENHRNFTAIKKTLTHKFFNGVTNVKDEVIFNIDLFHFYRSGVMVLVKLKKARTKLNVKKCGLLSL